MDKKKILIVDDEADLVDMVRIRLEASGYSVVVARDGEEGLKKAREERPDLIILDIMLPKVSGHAVCRMLKFDAKFKKTPIIMFTARAQESDKNIGKEVGADAYITKPFDSQALLDTIARLL